MFFIPIIGSFLEASGNILEKKVLRGHKVEYKSYMVYSFLAILLIMIPFIFFFWQLSQKAYEIINILIFIIIIIVALFANLASFYSLKRKTISELEPISLMFPLFTVVIAFLFSFFFTAYSSERNIPILILALIASIALIASHIEKHHLKFDKGIWMAILGSLLFATEAVISKFILVYYNSFTFYFIRCLFIFIISWIIFQPKLMSIKNKTKWLIFITSIAMIVYRIILYYSYETNGIIETTITLSILTPVFIFILAKVFLKEKIKLKHILSSAIILICVVATILIK